MTADRFRDGQNVRKVGRAVLFGRRANGDELEQAVADALFGVGRELQPTLVKVALDHHVETRLVDGNLARLQARHLTGVDIDADHVIACLSKAGARDQADVTRTKNCNFHA